MKIGIGLPSAIPEVSGSAIVEWAQRAEQRGFSALGVLDRLIYPNYDPLISLTAAAAVTERIGLCTAVLLAPLQANHVQFARQISSMESISGGRLILGLAVGSRRDDYDSAAVDFSRRGKIFDELLETATSIWRGERGNIGPVVPRAGGPPLFFGGESDPAIRRAARYGSGWIAGGGRNDGFAEQVARVQSAFVEAGRIDAPRVMKVGLFALGADAERHTKQHFLNYYGSRGEERLERALKGAYIGENAVTTAVTFFENAGCDEMILVPTNPDPGQVERLADLLQLNMKGESQL